MNDEFGNKFKYAEQDDGFVEQMLEIIGKSTQLMVIGFDPDAEIPLKVASNMDRDSALDVLKSLQSALQVVDANGN